MGRGCHNFLLQGQVRGQGSSPEVVMGSGRHPVGSRPTAKNEGDIHGVSGCLPPDTVASKLNFASTLLLLRSPCPVDLMFHGPYHQSSSVANVHPSRALSIQGPHTVETYPQPDELSAELLHAQGGRTLECRKREVFLSLESEHEARVYTRTPQGNDQERKRRGDRESKSTRRGNSETTYFLSCFVPQAEKFVCHRRPTVCSSSQTSILHL